MLTLEQALQVALDSACEGMAVLQGKGLSSLSPSIGKHREAMGSIIRSGRHTSSRWYLHGFLLHLDGGVPFLPGGTVKKDCKEAIQMQAVPRLRRSKLPITWARNERFATNPTAIPNT